MSRTDRRALRYGACIAALGAAMIAGGAGAQTAAAPAQAGGGAAPTDSSTVQEVVVTGFRASLQSALNVKRSANGVVDVIKAEDIAAFPDLNLAESLQRIPGVAITRVSGEGREISVRGLGPDYTRVRLNGMEALATSGSSDSGGGAGTNRSRGFDFNIFASELFNSLTVRKSASADVEEGSLGATVDLNTGRPFDYRKPTFSVSAQEGYNDLSGKADPRIAALATKTFDDGKLGVLVSAAYGERHIIEEGFGTTRWDNGASQTGFCSPAGYDVNPTTSGVQLNPNSGGANCGTGGPPRLPGTQQNIANWQLANSANTFWPRIPSYNSFEEGEKRLGLTGSVQWKPDDDTTISFDALYAKLDQHRNEKALQALGLSRNGTGKPQTTINAITVDQNNNVVSATLDNVDMRTQTRWVDEGTTFQQYSLSFDRRFGDRWRADGMVGYSQSVFETPNDTTITFDHANATGYQIDFGQNARTPYINIGFDPTQPGNWTANNGTSEVRLRPGYVANDFADAKFNLQWDATEHVSFKGGLDFRRYVFSTWERRRASETVSQTLTPQQIADNSYVFSGFGKGLDLPNGVATSWLVPDVQKYATSFDIYCNCGIYSIDSANNSSARGNTQKVREQDAGGYLMTMFHFDAFGLGWRGDAGVRYVDTRQRSGGFASNGGTVNWVVDNRSYSNVLPSMNLVAEVTDDFLIRFAAAKTIARPSLGSLSPGGDVSVQGANRSYNRGNPDLNPTMSKNLDLSFEWYPQKGAIYSLGLFYKDISTFAQTLRTSAIYNTLGLPDSLIAGTTATPTDDFVVTQPVNSPGGKLKGVEVNVQQPFTFLPGFLSHFGVIANYTFVDSNINYLSSSTPGAPTVSATLVGLSKNAANGTLYWENDRVSIRGSVAYRSGYLTQVPGRNNNPIEGTNATTNFDMEATYTINPHMKLTFEGLNLTNEANDQYVDFSNRVNAYLVSGRQFYVGFRYTY